MQVNETNEANGDKFKYQHQGIAWMFEVGLLDDPIVVNNIKVNILGNFMDVRDLEYLTLNDGRMEMLMWLDIRKFWFFRKRKIAAIEADVLEIMQKLLPQYKIRVVADRAIFDLALDNVRAFLAAKN